MLSYEFYSIKLTVFVTSGKIHLTEPTYRQTVVNFVFDCAGMCRFLHERIEKFSLFHTALLQTESIVKIDIPVNRLKPNNTT